MNFKLSKDRLNVLLIFLIINMQSFWISKYWNSYFTFIIMIMYIVVNIKCFVTVKQIKMPKFLLGLFMLWILFLFMMVIEGVFFSEFAILIKLIIYALVVFAMALMNDSIVEKAFSLTVIYNVIYGIYVSIDPTSIIMAGRNRYTYLTVTFSIAVSLCILLNRIVKGRNEAKLKKILYILGAILDVYVLLLYPARGNLLFPFFALWGCMLIENIKISKRFVRYALALVCSVFLFWYFLNSFSDIYVVQRILGMDLTSESRINIWKTCLDYVFQDFRWIIGIGLNQSEAVCMQIGQTYPHNFIVELFCEYGIIGLFISAVTFLILPIIAIERGLRVEHKSAYVFLIGTMYFFMFLTYSKSGSFYDEYLLFTFDVLLLKQLVRGTEDVSN